MEFKREVFEYQPGDDKFGFECAEWSLEETFEHDDVVVYVDITHGRDGFRVHANAIFRDDPLDDEDRQRWSDTEWVDTLEEARETGVRLVHKLVFDRAIYGLCAFFGSEMFADALAFEAMVRREEREVCAGAASAVGEEYESRAKLPHVKGTSLWQQRMDSARGAFDAAHRIRETKGAE